MFCVCFENFNIKCKFLLLLFKGYFLKGNFSFIKNFVFCVACECFILYQIYLFAFLLKFYKTNFIWHMHTQNRKNNRNIRSWFQAFPSFEISKKFFYFKNCLFFQKFMCVYMSCWIVKNLDLLLMLFLCFFYSFTCFTLSFLYVSLLLSL